MNITNAGVTHKIDGTDYEFSPLNLEDMEWLELWLKSRAIEAGRMSVPQDADEETADAMMAPVIAAANQINIFTSEGYEQLLTPGGVSRMLYRMLRLKQPKVTMEMCNEWLSDRGFMMEILPKIKLFSSSRGAAAAKGNGAAAKPARPSTARRSSGRSSRR